LREPTHFYGHIIGDESMAIADLFGDADRLNPHPASTYDMLIVAMGIWLQRQLGEESLTLITGDRIRQVVDRAKSVKLSRYVREHLGSVADGLGLECGPHLYPTVINLTNCSPQELRRRFSRLEPCVVRR
jgi:hypothetical protein